MFSSASGTRSDNTSAHSRTRYQLSQPGSPTKREGRRTDLSWPRGCRAPWRGSRACAPWRAPRAAVSPPWLAQHPAADHPHPQSPPSVVSCPSPSSRQIRSHAFKHMMNLCFGDSNVVLLEVVVKKNGHNAETQSISRINSPLAHDWILPFA